MRVRPYEQETLPDGTFRRTFTADTDDVELRWHRDERDREVTFVSGRGWSIQIEPELPRPITPGLTVSIPRDVWHRLIHSGDDSLQCVIREL